MNQNQRVPSWDLDHVGPTPPPPPPPPAAAPPPRVITSRSHSTSMSTVPDSSLLDYEVAELTWENGQLAIHGLGLPSVSSKSSLADAWVEKPYTRACGTLESIVNQAITKPQPSPTFNGGACEKDAVLVPCFDRCVGGGVVSGPMASISMTMEALVPTTSVSHNTLVGSSNASAAAARVPVGSEWSLSLSGSTGRESLKRRKEDTCKIVDSDLTNGLTTMSFLTSPYDSFYHTLPQGEGMEDEENGNNKASDKSSMSTKRSRAAASHSQAERKRRDKINQRMKTLQKLVPNSNKTDKASMLDEAIDYLKQLQAQVQMMGRMMMMMPVTTMQQLQMSSIMSQMGTGIEMSMPGFRMAMDHINMSIHPMALTRPGTNHGHGVGNATIFNPSNFMPSPLTTWDSTSSTATNGIGAGADHLVSQHQAMLPADPFSAAFLACQSQPMTMDTYHRMAAVYQQLQRLQQSRGL